MTRIGNGLGRFLGSGWASHHLLISPGIRLCIRLQGKKERKKDNCESHKLIELQVESRSPHRETVQLVNLNCEESDKLHSLSARWARETCTGMTLALV